MSKIIGIDGNSIMNRAFYGIMNSRIMVTSDGLYTNAIYGFVTILLKLLNEEKPDYLCVAFDRKAPTFRHQKYEGYKATRKGMPEELHMQMPVMKEVLQAMNIKMFEMDGYEADDILGTVSMFGAKRGMDVLLLTGDRDYLQLVSNKVTVRIPTTKQGVTESTDYTPEVVKEKFGIEPRQFIQIKGLMGDSSDNIPGVPGVGEKTAFHLIHKFKTLDKIYEAIESQEKIEDIKGKLREKLEANKELAYLSKDLGTICREVPIEISLEDMACREFDKDKLYDLFVRLQFRNYIEKLGLQAPDKKEKWEGTVEEEDTIEKEIPIRPLTEFLSLLQQVEQEPKEFAYDYEDSLMVYYQGVAYYAENLTVGELKQIFENDWLKIGYDEKKDYLALKQKEIQPQNLLFDLTIASYVLNPAKEHYYLQDMVLEELGIVMQEQKPMEQMSFLSLTTVNHQEEKAKRVQYIYACKQKLEKKLKEREEYSLFSEIEMPLMKVLAEMEYTGVLVDKNMLQEYSVELRQKVEALHDEIMELAGEEFNVNSPKQLGKILFEKLNLTVVKETKNGYGTDAEVLEKLRDEHPIIDKILEYRVLNKLRATYVDGLLPLIHPDTKRIHAKFNQIVTATGRISCTDPNLQNIPIRTEIGRQLRKIFVAPEGSILIDADYSQIELRILAHISGDPHMIDSFCHGEDIHAITASQVFHVPLEEVTKQMRSEAKAVNFGIVYGISDFGLSANINMPVRKAKEYIEKYFETYPGIKKYMENTVEKCKELGYVETLWGRRRYVPEIKSKNFNVRQFGERVAKNAPIQGTAADIIKIAMIHIQKELETRNLKSKLIIQVHDELLVEAKEEEFEEVKEILVRNMQEVAKMKVPLKVDANWGKTWFDAH